MEMFPPRDGKVWQIVAGGEPEPGEAVAVKVYFKQTHVDLVLEALALDGWTDEQPTAVLVRLARAGVALGAPAYAPDVLRKAAEEAIARVNA